MTDNIKHLGIVHDILDDCIKVQIVQISACASCSMSGHCNSSENKEKIIDVYGKSWGDLKIGEEVFVIASQKTGFFAVLLSSVIPLLLLVSVLFLVIDVTNSEAISALVSLGSLLPYYLIIYMMRNKIRGKLTFSIERK